MFRKWLLGGSYSVLINLKHVCVQIIDVNNIVANCFSAVVIDQPEY